VQAAAGISTTGEVARTEVGRGQGDMEHVIRKEEIDLAVAIVQLRIIRT